MPNSDCHCLLYVQNLLPGDLLIANVVSKSVSGLFLKLLCTDGGKHIVLEDLNLKAFCPTTHMIPADPIDTNRSYCAGDNIRLEVLEKPESEKLVLGMKGVTLSPDLKHSYQLGLITKYDLPRQYS